MAWVRSARVAETSTSTGTGAITLAGAYDSSYRRFNAVCSTGDTLKYLIVGSDGTWERGIGTYSSANTLTRTTVEESSNAGSAVTFAAASLIVFIDLADRFADLSQGVKDVNLDRHGTNSLEVNNGTPGTFADLFLRNLTLSGAIGYAGSQAMHVYTGMTGTWSRGASQVGTVSRTSGSTTATISFTAHGFAVGDYVYASSGIVAGWYSVQSVTTNTYTVTTAATTTLSAVSCTVFPPIIVTVTAHGLTAGTSYPISFADPRPGSQVLVNARYTIRQVGTNTFQLDGSTTVGGAASATIGTGVAGSSGTVALPFGATYTYSKPTGLVAVKVTVIGGGGQGKSTNGDVNPTYADSGGMSIKYVQASSLAANETVTVGAGGYTTASGAGAGQTGGTSSFGSWCSATGGLGGGAAATLSRGTGVGGDLNLPSITGRYNSSNPFGGAFQGYGVMPESPGDARGGFGFGAGGAGQADGASLFTGGHGTSGVVIVEEIY